MRFSCDAALKNNGSREVTLIQAWLNGINAGFVVDVASRANPPCRGEGLGLTSLAAPSRFPNTTHQSPAAQVQH